jgi:hypothetical protein
MCDKPRSMRGKWNGPGVVKAGVVCGSSGGHFGESSRHAGSNVVTEADARALPIR